MILKYRIMNVYSLCIYFNACLTCRNFRQVQKEENFNVTREIPFYNQDTIG